MAVAQVPSAPAPYTTARPPGGGGVRVTAWRATENGSARTATSSVTSSGTGISIRRWAGSSSANPPVASDEFPVWIPGVSEPSWKCQHRLKSPASHAGHDGSMPRTSHESHGLSTTR